MGKETPSLFCVRSSDAVPEQKRFVLEKKALPYIDGNIVSGYFVDEKRWKKKLGILNSHAGECLFEFQFVLRELLPEGGRLVLREWD